MKNNNNRAVLSCCRVEVLSFFNTSTHQYPNTPIPQFPNILIALIIAMAFLFPACGEDFFFEKTYDIPNAEWTHKDSLIFEVDIQDTLKTYNLLLDIEHSTDYAFQNNYVFVHTYLPNGEHLGKQLNIDFAEKSGKWNGKCSGEQCKLRAIIQQNAYFNQIGTHRFTIEQFMRIDPLPGIRKVSLRLQETGEER